MTIPTVVMEVAWTNPPFAASPTWVDVTSRLRSCQVNRGRKGALDSFREGTATFILNNRDRALEPEYAAGAYYPNVVPNRRVRLKGAGTVVFDGYIDSIRPVYVIGAAAGDAYVEVACTDLTKFLARAKLESPYAYEVRADAPTHWWRCGDPPNSTVMADSGSVPVPGVWSERVALGASPIVNGSNVTAATLQATDTTPPPGHIPGSAMPTGTSWSFEMVVERPAELTLPIDLFSATGPRISGPVNTFTIRLSTSGLFDASFVEIPGVWFRPQVYLPDGQLPYLNDRYPLEDQGGRRFHLAFTRNGSVFKFYLNGVEIATSTNTTSVGPYTDIDLGVVTDPANFGFQTTVGEIALYDGTVLSAARILAHASALLDPWKDDSTGTRIARVATQAGIPTALQSLDTGNTTGLARIVDPIDGVAAIGPARDAEVTEQGALFVNAAGILTFYDRHHNTNTNWIAPSFGDGGTASGEVPYSDLVEDYSEQTIINEALVTRQGGVPQKATDATSQANYGTYGHALDGTLYATDVEANDAAASFVDKYKDPLLRFQSITIDGQKNALTAGVVVARDIGDRIIVYRRPPGGGAIQTKEVVVEGVTHELDAGNKSWKTVYSLSPADTRSYWQLTTGFSTLGTNTKLGF